MFPFFGLAETFVKCFWIPNFNESKGFNNKKPKINESWGLRFICTNLSSLLCHGIEKVSEHSAKEIEYF